MRYLLNEKTGGTPGVRDFNLLESSIETPFQVFAGEELHPTIQEKGTRLGYGLIKCWMGINVWERMRLFECS